MQKLRWVRPSMPLCCLSTAPDNGDQLAKTRDHTQLYFMFKKALYQGWAYHDIVESPPQILKAEIKFGLTLISGMAAMKYIVLSLSITEQAACLAIR